MPLSNAGTKILVVDDEQPIRESIARALNLLGYQAQEASSGREALNMLETKFDVLVLDMRMPEMDGVEVMRRARQTCPDLLILVLTGHATLESAIAAVKSSATDYLLKPASVRDIAATISTALQARAEQLRQKRVLHMVGEMMETLRQAETPPSASLPAETSAARFLRAGALTLDRQKRLTVVSGEPPRTAELTEGEALILAPLMEHPDRVFSCRQLARAAWDYDLDEQEAQSLVRPHIFRLRHKIETDPENPHLIRTVRGRGYLLAP